MEDGATVAELEKEIAKCRGRKRRTPSDEADQAYAEAEVALEANQEFLASELNVLDEALQMGRIILQLSQIAAAIPAVGRILRVISIPAPIIIKQIEGRLAQIVVRRAANDKALAIIRRAAANEREFLRQANQ